MPEPLPLAEQHKLVSQVNEHHVKINQLSEEIKVVNASVNHVQSSVNDVQSTQASMKLLIELGGKRTEDLIGSLKGELQHSDNQYVRDKSDEAKKPATIRQAVLFQVVALVVAVSGSLYVGFQNGLKNLDLASEARHQEQKEQIERERSKNDLQILQWGDYREWKGTIDTKREWDRSDIDAQKQDLPTQ